LNNKNKRTNEKDHLKIRLQIIIVVRYLVGRELL